MKNRNTVSARKELKARRAKAALLTRSIITGVLIFSCLSFGAVLGMYFVLGMVTLTGLILVVESIPMVKFLFKKFSRVIDILILLGSILAVMYYGVTVAASLTIAGIGYSLWYAPYLRSIDMDVSVVKYRGIPYGVSFS